MTGLGKADISTRDAYDRNAAIGQIKRRELRDSGRRARRSFRWYGGFVLFALKCSPDTLSYLSCNYPITGLGVMNVSWPCKKVRGKTLGELIQIVDHDAMLFHNAGCHLIVFLVVTNKSASISFRYNSRVRPDQLRAGFLKTIDQLHKVFLVLFQWGGD